MKNLLLSILLVFSLAACKSTKPGFPESSASWLDGAPSPLGDQTAAVNVVYFAFDSSNIDQVAKEKLSEQASLWHATAAKPNLVVEGHTDLVGDKEYNFGLGIKRANSARKQLEKHGVDSSKIEIISYGLERPASMDNDALNRRSVTLAVK